MIMHPNYSLKKCDFYFSQNQTNFLKNVTTTSEAMGTSETSIATEPLGVPDNVQFDNSMLENGLNVFIAGAVIEANNKTKQKKCYKKESFKSHSKLR